MDRLEFNAEIVLPFAKYIDLNQFTYKLYIKSGQRHDVENTLDTFE